MPAYTFHSLSDADFEDLACDLFSAELEMRFQPFTKGRDSGIDLLHGACIQGSTVVQCKHYCGSTYANLKSKVINEELPKLAKLNPSRFILATSRGLTPSQKAELMAHLAPYCKGINDIYGKDDLNALLRKHPKVETAHYKLWLTSVPVLQRMLRHGAAVWDAMTKDEIKRKMSLYVQTDAYGAAMKLLNEHNYCILSGIPGVGKTTLAQVLVTHLMENGYELIAVRENAQEAFDAFDRRKKQVVYYDDFLGQSSIGERLGKNEDRTIVRLLVEAGRSKHLKVVFTTREYILEDAKRVYEPLSRADLDVAKCTVKVEDYTRGNRARILYNHIYFSGLSQEYTAALLRDKGYRRIIDHKGYSPRIVEWMTSETIETIPSSGYVDRFVEAMDNPAYVWQHAFDNQINADARSILFVLGSIEGWLGLDELRRAWGSLRGIQSVAAFSMEQKQAFRAAMKQLEGSFTRSMRAQLETAVEFHNPSIKDYVRRRIVGDIEVQQDLLRSAPYFDQVACLVSLGSDGRVGFSPGGLVPDDAILHDAICRTIDAKSAIYNPIHYRSNNMIGYFRKSADIGDRLTRIAKWSTYWGSKEILHVCCTLAIEMVASGEVESAATASSCGFLSAAIKAFPEDIRVVSMIKSFVTEIDKRLEDSGSVSDWEELGRFIKSSTNLFDEHQVEAWARRAELCCLSTIDEAIDNSDTSSDLEAALDDVSAVVKHWNLMVDLRDDKFEQRLDDLRAREDGPDDDDDRRIESTPADRASGGDA